MASIFRLDDNFVDQPKRNTVDLSFQNNITTNFGKLPVCFIKPVVPGESLRIKTTFGFRFMPMTFPVQTRMKASVNFFYVRNRNLWKDFPDFIGRTKQGLVPPYIHLTDLNRKQIETCQLGDFLGLPTEIYGKTFNISSNCRTITNYLNTDNYEPIDNTSAYITIDKLESDINEQLLIKYYDIVTKSTTPAATPRCQVYTVVLSDVVANPTIKVRFSSTVGKSVLLFDTNGNLFDFKHNVDLDVTGSESVLTYTVPKDIRTSLGDRPFLVIASLTSTTVNVTALSWSAVQGTFIDTATSVSDLPLSELPWRSDDNPNGIPLSSLPFRAYESIYNVFYRNPENNPLIINGVPEYNKWIRTNEGGAETNFYSVMYHNWEDDFLTTAVPSPQQGNAPLVGLSGTATVTLAHDDGTTTTATLDVDDNGQVIAVNEQSGDDITTLSLMEAVNYGISINDFRNVNSFQRWLENNIRRGYKYKDQIKTHYGVSVRYDELDMPEFIGGVSENVMVNQISQTVPTEDSPLGDMAGQASVVGTSHDVEHYCDEHGFIIGILCIKPVANYSQLLPKYWNITDAFDYYFPEFGHIGMQPIKNWEVAPLQANLEGKLNDTFGYQRAWYDMIASTDEVHGLFRTNLRNFLINRTFDGTPELGSEFTVMDPDQLNEVFSVTENTDKIIGQVYFECSKKTPVPLYGIPKLE